MMHTGRTFFVNTLYDLVKSTLHGNLKFKTFLYP